MNNIRIVKTGINVSKILKQLKENPKDWGSQKQMDGTDSMLNYGFPEVEAGVLQLVMGAVDTLDQYVGDTEYCIPTPACRNHTEIIAFLHRDRKSTRLNSSHT